MSQNPLNQGDGDGATVRTGLVAGLQALATMQSGATAPATTYPYMLWADTTAGILKQRNAANSAWIDVGTLDQFGLGILDRITGTASFKQLNSTPALATIGQILGFISTLTPGSETGGLRFNSKIAGVLTKLLELETVARLFGAAAELSWTDNGAGEGPDWDLIRESNSPAANDLLAGLRWKYRDSGANLEIGAKIVATLLDPTNGSEDVALDLFTQVAGALASRMQLRNGLIMAGASGGDPGAGQINAQGFKVNGVAIGGTSNLVAIFQDQKTNGTTGGTPVATTWTKRTLNTSVANNTGSVVSIASSVINFASGKWILSGVQAFYNMTTGYAGRFQNTTDNVTLGLGQAGANTGQIIPSPGFGFIDASGGSKNVELQYFCGSAVANGLGLASAPTGTPEIFANVSAIQVG